MRTLTAYGIGVVIVLAILNGIAWQAGTPRLHSLNVFSAGSVSCRVLRHLGIEILCLLEYWPRSDADRIGRIGFAYLGRM